MFLCFIFILFPLFCKSQEVVPAFNYHTNAQSGTFIIDNFNRTDIENCPGSGEIGIPVPCVGPTYGDLISSVKSPHSFLDTVEQKVVGWANTATVFLGGQSDMTIENAFIHNGDAGAATGIELILFYGNKTGAFDLTFNGTQNSFIFTNVSSDRQLMFYDITVYGTNGNVSRLLYGHPETPYTKTLTKNEWYSAKTPNPEIFIPYDLNSDVYTSVSSIEVRTRLSLLYTQSHNGWDASFGSTFRTGFVSGCIFNGNFKWQEFKGSDHCDSELFSDACSSLFSGEHILHVDGPLVLSSANYNPLPYGNTFTVDSTGTSTMLKGWGIRPPFTQIAGKTPSLNRMGILYAPISFPNSDLQSENITLDFRALSQDNSRLFKNVTIRIEHHALFSSFVTNTTGIGPTFTFLGDDLSNVIQTIIPTAENTGRSSLVSIASFNAGSNVIRGVRINHSTFTATLSPDPVVGIEEILTYTLEADGDCIVRPTPSAAPCVDIIGYIFEDLNYDGLQQTFELFVSGIEIRMNVSGEPYPRFITISSPLTGQYIINCVDVGATIELTYSIPFGYIITTGQIGNTTTYVVNSDQNQSFQILGIATIPSTIQSTIETTIPSTTIPSTTIETTILTASSTPSPTFISTTVQTGTSAPFERGINDTDKSAIIIGSTVGGVIGAAGIVGIVYYFMQKNKKSVN